MTRPTLRGRHVRLALTLTLGLAATAALAGCAASEDSTVTFPPASIGPDRTVSPAVSLTRSSLEIALRDRGLSLTNAQVPFRPAESPRLTDAPRAVYQVVLPKDPAGGYLVVYEFPDPDLANQAAQEQAQYLATGPGRVQSSLEAVDVIRVVGSTVILYEWIPGEAKDPTAAGIQPALETLGLGIPVPS
jgi:hypothetical protein